MEGINLDYYIPGAQEYFNQEKLNENTEKTKASIEKLAQSADGHEVRIVAQESKTTELDLTTKGIQSNLQSAENTVENHETRIEAQEVQTTELESSKLFRKKLGRPGGWGPYIKAVIILHKIGTSSVYDSAPRAYCSGTFLFSRSALSYKVSAEVLTGSGHTKKYNQASMFVQGTLLGHNLKLVEFDYNENRYIGLEIYFTEAEIHDAFFSGEIGGRDIDANALKWVMYYNTNEKEILNEEIYNSIQEVDETQDNFTNTVLEFNRNTIYHAGNSYPIVEKGSNANGEYIRFADGTQICTRRVEHNYNTNYNQPWSFPAQFVEVYGGGFSFDTSGKLSGTADNTVYWDNLHKTVGGIYRGCGYWYTLTRETLFDAKGYIYLTATGKWK